MNDELCDLLYVKHVVFWGQTHKELLPNSAVYFKLVLQSTTSLFWFTTLCVVYGHSRHL